MTENKEASEDDKYKRPEVNQAARDGDIDRLNTLIKEGKPTNLVNYKGWRALHEAAAHSPSMECLLRILKHKDTNVNWRTKSKETALLLACRRSSDADAFVTELLLHGADPSIKDEHGDSPLFEAVSNGHQNVVQELLNAGADVNARYLGCFPLREAIDKRNSAIVKLLLTHPDIIMDDKDLKGQTPLFLACNRGYDEIVQELLSTAKKKGLDDFVNQGIKCRPLLISANQGRETVVKMLLEHGADTGYKETDKATALHYAIIGKNDDCLKMILEKMDTDRLIKLFHPLTYKKIRMTCPLHKTVEFERYEMLRALLAVGFSPDSLDTVHVHSSFHGYDPDYETALGVAIYDEDETAFNILLEAGASCDPPRKDAAHPLFRALAAKDATFFDALLEKGVAVNYFLENGVNEVLMWALEAGDPCRLIMLLYCGCDPNMDFLNEEVARDFIKYAAAGLEEEKIEPKRFVELLFKFMVVKPGLRAVFTELCNSYRGMKYKYVEKKLSCPSSLKKLCVMSIRRQMSSVHGSNLPEETYKFGNARLQEMITCNDVLGITLELEENEDDDEEDDSGHSDSSEDQDRSDDSDADSKQSGGSYMSSRSDDSGRSYGSGSQSCPKRSKHSNTFNHCSPQPPESVDI